MDDPPAAAAPAGVGGDEEIGLVDEEGGDGGPAAAGLGDALGDGLRFLASPVRWAVRMATVQQMKDRAGVVGVRGVGPLVRDLLTGSTARLHLLGHSYGARVMLAAVASGGPPPRRVRSLLLLQPAVNHLCFAADVPGAMGPGGFRPVLGRVERPVLSTFSRQDVPLHKTFHLALRRKADLGEPLLAAEGEPPSRYAALGGYGPRGAGERLIAAHAPADPYTFDPAVPLYGLHATGLVTGHGDVANAATTWMLHTLAFA
jgi:pimeloyl-ACP methyl ester carboxylesterase